MHRPFLAAGAVLAFLAVAAGAFGAHGLEGTIPAERLATFDTAARYQMYHALALLFVGMAGRVWPRGFWAGPALLFLAGVVVFSGSLYALALTGQGWLGAVAPIGGATLLAGWLWLTIVALRASGGANG
ncbi:MAG: DUF423 domain-containing protein [Gemmatimonadota bacterium]|nr:DUF423 domain-containing protein [Gemmatimonadota bacterium]